LIKKKKLEESPRKSIDINKTMEYPITIRGNDPKRIGGERMGEIVIKSK